MADSPPYERVQAPNYFVPMVDMLAGVIFILVILLVSVALVARQDFAATEGAQREIARIEAELARARATENTYLHPRRLAREATAFLLRRLRDHLDRRGVAAEIDEPRGTLRLSRAELFGGSFSLTKNGQEAAEALASGLATYLPCGAGAATAPQCSGFPPVRLARAVIAVHGPGLPGANSDGKTATEAQSLDLYAALVRVQPMLLALRNAAGQPLLGYAGFGESAPLTNAPKDRIDLIFEMDVPPLPAAE